MLIGGLELICGTVLFFIYEASKTSFYNSLPDDAGPNATSSAIGGCAHCTLPKTNDTCIFIGILPFIASITAARNLDLRTPLDFLFWTSSLNNVAAFFGLAGILGNQRELVIFFFTYNAAQLVLTLNYFIDVLFDLTVRYAGADAAGLNGYERAAAAFLFCNFLLSIGATYFAVKAVQEIKQKQREEYRSISVVPDSLAFDS